MRFLYCLYYLRALNNSAYLGTFVSLVILKQVKAKEFSILIGWHLSTR